MRQKLVAGNWKMHGDSQSIRELLTALKPAVAESAAEIAVIPPLVYVPLCADLLAGSSIALGAQTVSEQRNPGAFTGEVCADMLADSGCRYTLVGHSERRSLYGENDALVAAKTEAALAANVLPIVCVGETKEQREAGATLDVVGQQIDVVLSTLNSGHDKITVAYEPVWAIGTGLTASPEQAQEVHAFIRTRLAAHSAELADTVRILYGGSVKAANAAELFAQPDIDGGLVGGASLDAEEFAAICNAIG
ncbi:triosephosphate isomerase [Litorivivens lipolytica]|uniref:Triosephosphate isomerase n=1 Tax=Litorivivens lipolytica TaxID=1524264 RepID=A0A7W4W4M4_9GAMM|nr:triose-phosphate isomerase [Litorivivens lipolytica]MBB3046814.1 triosephosphate isomerase [Litorivivens lipolytica]